MNKPVIVTVRRHETRRVWKATVSGLAGCVWGRTSYEAAGKALASLGKGPWFVNVRVFTETDQSVEWMWGMQRDTGVAPLVELPPRQQEGRPSA